MIELPDELQQILKESPEKRKETTLAIARSHMDVEGQLSLRIYAEWYIRTYGGKSAGGVKGIGFAPWLKDHEADISRKTAYRLIREYAEARNLPRPQPRTTGRQQQPAPTLLPGKQGEAIAESPEIEESDVIPAPTSPRDMEEIVVNFIREMDDVTLREWWQKMNDIVAAELLARNKAEQNDVDAA